MRILVLSNLYPPHYLGGYELACAEVVDALRQRGHHVTVLTSTRGLRFPRIRAGILRLLRVRFHIDPPFRAQATELFWSLWNRLVLRSVAGLLAPDIILVYNPMGLGAFVLQWLHAQPRPVVHDVSDAWLPRAYEDDIWFRGYRRGAPRPLQRAARWALVALAPTLLSMVPTPIDLRGSFFRSAYLRVQMAAAGFATGNEPVIHHALRHAQPHLSATSRGRYGNGGIVLSGQLNPEKGLHVFLEALALLKDNPTWRDRRITIIGGANDPVYRRRLQGLADALRPHLTVHFAGKLPRAEALALMREHTVFVFPVIWAEPFSIVLLEALSAGLAVVATATGGSTEILADGENCLVVPTDDPRALAQALSRVVDDEALRGRIAAGGPATVRHFNFERAIDRIEDHLQRVAGKNRKALSFPHTSVASVAWREEAGV